MLKFLGNVLKYRVAPRGRTKGSINILGCKIAATDSSSRVQNNELFNIIKAFELSSKKTSTIFKAESDQARNAVNFITFFLIINSGYR
jgi:hypothetical protein